MMRRTRGYLTAAVAAGTASLLVASPAFAEDLDETRRRFGFFSGLSSLCCLFVVALVVLGIVIGVMVSKRKR